MTRSIRVLRRRRPRAAPALAVSAVAWLASIPAVGQDDDAAADWAASLASRYRVAANITYLEADGHESKLDVIAPRQTTPAAPTLIYFHGGGWVGGTKESSVLALLPWLEMGFAAVNVEYRLAKVALAPAAVEDCRCALRWVLDHAADYGFDPERIVVSGASAGGHLSLTTGMLPASAGFDRRCPARSASGSGPVDAAEPEMRVAAIVNWFGISDVAAVVEGAGAKTYGVAWFGGLPDRLEIARRVSPLTHVRPGLPPVLTVHGDADEIVEHVHATRLHAALDAAGVPNRVLTIAGGGHGTFTPEQWADAYDVVRGFLREHVPGLGTRAATSP
jgi:acetyl esterase/lipase